MRIPFFTFVLLSFAGLSANAQTTASCLAAPTALSPTAHNIFNERQEQDLGDAYAQIQEAHLRFVNDPADEATLEKIGRRLLAVLPPNSFQFRYKIVDADEVNAFSIAGGHIYFTRKLIAAAANEDELAGVMAHEIGHILIHQQAIETSAEWEDTLHVTAAGDRADIFEKVQRLRDMAHGGWHPSGEKYEETADAVALYVLMKAGYKPDAYAEFWNQVTETHGNTGSALGGLFHALRPAQVRLRAILKNAAAIPPGCEEIKPPVVTDFSAWRKQVVAAPAAGLPADLPDHAVQLTPPLHPDLTRVQFSPDGKYALAQDLSKIFVLSRSPFRLLFQIDAVDADPASFSPDSTRISFSTPSLRVEQWEIASQQLLGAYEVISYKPCLLHLLSPDGQVMACILNTSSPQQHQFGLTLWNVAESEVLLKKDDAFSLSSLDSGQNTNFGFGFTAAGNYSWWVTSKLHWPIVRWAFSPDGSRLMANREPTTLVYNLAKQTFEKAEGAIAKLNRKPFAFVSNDRIAIDNWDSPEKSAVYSFPGGNPIKQIALGDNELSGVTHGDYMKVSPMKDAALGLVDLGTGQILFSLPNEVLDVYDKTVLMETGEGGVELTSQGLVPNATNAENLDLPISQLGEISAAVVSTDGKLLALSNKSRSALWDVETGRRLIYTRPFSAGYFDDTGQFYADFPKYHGQNHAQAAIDPRQHKASKLPYEATDHVDQLDDLLVEFKPLGAFDQDTAANSDLEVRDLKTNQVLWTRRYPHQTPLVKTMGRGNEMMLAWANTYAGTGHDEVKAHPELIEEEKKLHDETNGFLVEVVDKHTGKYLRGVVVEVSHFGAFFFERITPQADAAGDFVFVRDGRGSTLIYRFSTGARLGEVFGRVLAQDAVTGLFCASNSENELAVYDAATVHEVKRFAYPSRISFATFLSETKKLLVVTSDQKIHIVDLGDSHPNVAR